MIIRRSAVGLAAAGLIVSIAATACGSSSSGNGPASSGSASASTSASISASASTSASTSSSSSAAPAASICGGKTGSGKVVIGAASFAENETLAAIYAAALKECGYSTSVKDFDSREVYYPELKKGAIQVVPEYAATLTDFINNANNGANAPSKASGVLAKTVKALKAELPSSLAVLNAATATDKNGFAVKKSFATAHHITTMSQLGAYSKSHPISLAGPSECPTRPFCEPGLKSTYGFNISHFVQTDEGGPLTDKALKSGKATVGLLFTSDPTLASNGLVFLTDDKHLQDSDNVIPLVASSLATGAAANALNAVQAKLNQTTLVAINKAVQIDRGTPTAVATQFLKQEGLS